ncbi:MAG: hypothetical protein HUK21_10645 [Fibrobacteraceae bacterium]|nr:hypothetical protein [Fibrobacteraceae bacterium]
MRWLLLLWGFAVFLWGCAATTKNPPSTENSSTLLEQSSETPIEIQDSLRAKFSLTITQKKNGSPTTQNLDAVIFSVPGKRYRMELTGPMGVGVASLLWQEDGWKITFPTEKTYMEGAGYMVGLLGDKSVPMVNIHQVADLFRGVLVPENAQEISRDTLEDGSVEVLAQNGAGVKFRYGIKLAVLDSISESGDARGGEGRGENISWVSLLGSNGKVLLKEYKEFDGVKTPKVISFERDGEPFLSISVKKIDRNKSFSRGTWHLNVPRSFVRIN